MGALELLVAFANSMFRSTSAAQLRLGRFQCSETVGCSSPAKPAHSPLCRIVICAQRPGWKLGSSPVVTSSSTPNSRAMANTESSESRQVAGVGLPHTPADSIVPVYTIATCSGCTGNEACIEAQVWADGFVSTPGSRVVCVTSPRKTVPISKRARSLSPRPTFRAAVANNPGSRLERIFGERSEIGFTKVGETRRESPSGKRNASRSGVPINGYARISCIPRPASRFPIRRRRRCSNVKPLPAGAVGSVEGSFSYPTSRTTSSTRSAG